MTKNQYEVCVEMEQGSLEKKTSHSLGYFFQERQSDTSVKNAFTSTYKEEIMLKKQAEQNQDLGIRYQCYLVA